MFSVCLRICAPLFAWAPFADDADLIIKAAFDEMSVKESVFRRLDAVARQGPFLLPSCNDGILRHVRGEEVPGLGNMFLVSDEHPRPPEDAGQFLSRGYPGRSGPVD